MKTDTLLIESYLEKTLTAEDVKKVEALKSNDNGFRQNFLFQAKVYFAVLIYGRIRRRAEILAAADKAFSDANFNQQITNIFT